MAVTCRHFGSWNSALIRAKANPKRYRLRRYPSSFSRRNLLHLSFLSFLINGRSLAETSPEEPAPIESYELTEEEAERLMKEEEERRKQKTSRRGRLRELEDTRAELAEKELELFEKEKELFQKDQSLIVLREELELERKIRALLTKEKEQATEEAALARGLCTGANLLP